jgi:nitrogen fixation NifU-like protein
VTAVTDLYREVVLDHRRSPRHHGKVEAPTAEQHGANLFCGDEIGLGVRLDGDRVAEVAFDGQGCTISQASASMMTELIQGHSRAKIEEIAAAFHRMLSGDGSVDEDLLGDAAVLAGVRQFPARVKCALLPWTTLVETLAAADRASQPE